MRLKSFASSTALEQEFALEIGACLKEAIRQRGRAYLAVSGGKTPKGLFCHLAKMVLPWEKVTITLTDERRVVPTHADSNEHLLKQYLLKEKAKKAGFISLYSEKDRPEELLTELEQRLADIPVFDLVILGLGEDGHTASLFPHQNELAKALADDNQASVALMTASSVPHQRISLTKTRLLKSRKIALHFVGEKKMAVLQRALTENNAFEMPIRAFLFQDKVELEVVYA